MRGLPLSMELVREIDTLVQLKSATKEMGEGRRVPVLDKFISDEYSHAATWLQTEAQPIAPPYEAANKVFRRLVIR